MYPLYCYTSVQYIFYKLHHNIHAHHKESHSTTERKHFYDPGILLLIHARTAVSVDIGSPFALVRPLV